MKQTFFNSIVAACFMGIIGSAALADKGGLILPDHPGASVELQLQNDLTGLDPASVLQVFVGRSDDCCAGKLPISGQHRLDGQRLTFDPAFEFVAGQFYTVQTRVIGPDHVATSQLTQFIINPQETISAPKVVAIYPSGPVLPENTLRFYVQFSAPMKPHVSTDFVTLVDAEGTPDTAAFMTFKQELWNADRTRLTLLMDPGRIKRGVAQNIDLGPALLAGQRYSIRVAKGWQGARSQQEAPAFEHTFVVSNALRHVPSTDLWQFQKPRMSTSDPLVITFDRPFDAHMARHAIHTTDADGQVILGSVTIKDAERTWQFVPRKNWSVETLRVVVDADLEDVAGNNFNELLDHAVSTEADAVDQYTVTVRLDARPG